MSKIGVFICHCGENISATVDVERVAREVGQMEGVAHAIDYKYMCSDPGQTFIKEAVKKHGDSFLTRVFTAQELKYCRNRKALRFPELAVRFAAKEAYSKAIGTGIKGFGRVNDGIGWREIEIVNNSQGKPQLSIR